MWSWLCLRSTSLYLLVLVCVILILGSEAKAQSWLQLAPSGALPNGRVGAKAVFSPASNRLIVFGGNTVHTSSPFIVLNDLWILSAANGIGTPSWQQAI